MSDIYRSRHEWNTATPQLRGAFSLTPVTWASSQQLYWYLFLQVNLTGLWFLFFLAIYMVCILCKQYGRWGPLSATLMVYRLWKRWRMALGTMFRVSWMEKSKSRCRICTPGVSYFVRRAKKRRNNHTNRDIPWHTHQEGETSESIYWKPSIVKKFW